MFKHILIVIVACTLLLLNSSAIAAPVTVTWSETLASALVYTPHSATNFGYSSSITDPNNAVSINVLGKTQFAVTNSPSAAQCNNANECANITVPVPNSAWLFASALGFLCIIRRRLHR
ncbi:MAG: hypothetical protein ACXW1T_05560 [Methylophilus sp.]